MIKHHSKREQTLGFTKVTGIYMYLKKAWYLKTYIDANSSIDFEKLHQIKTNGCLVLTRHQSSLKTNQISVGPYFLEIREEKGSC